MKKPSQDLVNAFFAWYRTNPHSANEDVYANTVTREAIESFSRGEFIQFFVKFAYDGGKVQSGGHRTAPLFQKTIEDKYEQFRRFVLEPFGSDFDVLAWLGRTDSFPGFGQGLSTIYLNRVDKKRYAIINNKAIDAMTVFEVQVPSSLTPRFEAIRSAEGQLIEWYPEFENYYRTDSLTHFLVGEEVGRQWHEELSGIARRSGNATRAWIYAPGERARHWDQFRAEGVMGIGWDEISQDLATAKSEADLRQIYNFAYSEGGTEHDLRQVSDFVFKMKVGDRVFVKRGVSEIVGFGEVTSDYFYDASRKEYRHLRKANWINVGSWSIPEGAKGLPVKTLTEIKDPIRLEALLAMIGHNPDQVLFEKEAFELLCELQRDPSLNFYNEHAAQFDRAVETPLKRLLGNVASKLPTAISAPLETQKHLFSRIAKNDYGKGGAWDYFWGAFYPKGGKRTADAQLYVFISGEILRYGFYIGDYGVDPRSRFIENCKAYGPQLKELLKASLSGSDLQFGLRPRSTTSPEEVPKSGTLSWTEWLDDPQASGLQVAVELSPIEVATLTEAEITKRVAGTFERLFPLVLLAQSPTPIESIQRYLGTEPPPNVERLPPLSIEEVAKIAHISVENVARHVRAINRKKQAILYGPPGTGKTFLARHLARHLVGGGDGFIDLVQFHPSYAYEDFLQGLRPKALTSGGLEYIMVAGRFKEFCDEASECKDLCVLIIDEINRANLSRVFGELMYLLEYRSESAPLASGGAFQIPDNVRIIGTMNTADRSIALVDHALRRRFAFLALYPDYDILRRFHAGTEFNADGLINVLEQLNIAIKDPHYAIGVSYFLDPDIDDNLEDVWRMEIEPYIEELFVGQADKAKGYRWEDVRPRIYAT